MSGDLEKVTEADLLSQPFLTNKDVGRIKHSVANWLHLQHPIVIVDEAHNNRTDRFFKTLGRLKPSCVVELTATPVPGNNVLYHVSAQELKAEQMIKLPIVLAEHPAGWQDCLRDAILTRDRLEISAQKETDYLRPIALIQAAPKGNEATVDVVRIHLIENEKDTRGPDCGCNWHPKKDLVGINLFDPACQIRYVITVEALKEGWDCSFAYVLASLQSVNSAKDVEQLLGRVLRMPYAKTRQQETLNRAYAHIVAENFAQAAASLTDKMVQNMGFERFEANIALVPAQPELPLGEPMENGSLGQQQMAPVIPDCYIAVSGTLDTQYWPEDLKQVVTIGTNSMGTTLLVKGDIDSDTLGQVEDFVSNAVPAKAREAIKEQFNAHRALRQAVRAPAQLGLTFAPIPQLCLNFDDYLEVVERETLSTLGDWDLLDQPVQLSGFNITESINSFEIDVSGEKK
ncbi:DEAD/DEAH box helicase [Undibacterium arcticum]